MNTFKKKYLHAIAIASCLAVGAYASQVTAQDDPSKNSTKTHFLPGNVAGNSEKATVVEVDNSCVATKNVLVDGNLNYDLVLGITKSVYADEANFPTQGATSIDTGQDGSANNRSVLDFNHDQTAGTIRHNHPTAYVVTT